MPVATTIQHVATMVGRWLSFFRERGPALVDGFTLLGGYTETVDMDRRVGLVGTSRP